MTKKLNGAKSPITLRHLLPIAAVLLLFTLVFVVSVAAAEDGALDLAWGPIIITATGYTQGDAEEETTYTDYTITQSILKHQSSTTLR